LAARGTATRAKRSEPRKWLATWTAHEAKDLTRFLKRGCRKFIGYPSYVPLNIRAGLYPGDASLVLPPGPGLGDWIAGGAKEWSSSSARAVAAPVGKHLSGLREKDVATPFPASRGGNA
jgi:hypothetical protein